MQHYIVTLCRAISLWVSEREAPVPLRIIMRMRLHVILESRLGGEIGKQIVFRSVRFWGRSYKNDSGGSGASNNDSIHRRTFRI